MNRMAPAPTAFDVEPDVALAHVARHPGPIIVDLDETLYLRNSTEDFLDSARPALLALVLLRLLDVVQPWRWTGGVATRDVWRVRVVGTLMPWTWSTWQARAPDLAAEFTNQALLTGLRSINGRLVVATVGFQPIVAPLLRAMGLADARLLATNASWLSARQAGKLPMVERALGERAVAESLVLTDSTDDLPLLERCARPLRTLWPEARFRRALSHVYLPGEYTTFVKRPGEMYLSRSVIREDFACWLFASLALASAPLFHTIGLGLLLISFWAIYELGYMDNDLQAARFEAKPHLTDQYFTRREYVHQWQPLFWAAGAGVLGLAVLRYPARPVAADVGRWLFVLLATLLWFRLYNRFDKQTRIWMFVGLQFARAGAFLILVPAAPIAVSAIGALLLARWVPYYHYRVDGEWPRGRQDTARLLFFVVLATLQASTQGVSTIANGTALSFLVWNALWARKELWSIRAEAERIDSGPGRDPSTLSGMPWRRKSEPRTMHGR